MSKNWNIQKALIHDRLLPYLTYAVETAKDAGRNSLFVGTDSHIVNDLNFDDSKERRKAESLSHDLADALRGTEFNRVNGWHAYRHTLASLYLARGIAATQIEAIVGWEPNSGMVSRYAHATKESQINLLKQIGQNPTGVMAAA